MIAFITGTVASYNADTLVVDHNGMGWLMSYPHCDNVSLNQQIKVHTYMHITESDICLYGFESEEEKQLFMRLISVKGLGPKTAMNMLAKAGSAAIISAIETGNVSSLKKMPGIGAKSASQIVLDLKGRLVSVQSDNTKKNNPAVEYPVEIREAIDGLKNLGYRQNELNDAVNYMLQNPGLTTAQYLKMGLQFLQKQKLKG